MKQGLVMLTLLMLANLVAAGVIGQLAQLTREAAPWTRDEWWPWVIIAAIGIACAIAFLRGAVETLAGTNRKKRKTP